MSEVKQKICRVDSVKKFATMLRSVEAGSFMKKELAGSVIPTGREVSGHYYHICQILVETSLDYRKKNSPALRQ